VLRFSATTAANGAGGDASGAGDANPQTFRPGCKSRQHPPVVLSCQLPYHNQFLKNKQDTERRKNMDKTTTCSNSGLKHHGRQGNTKPETPQPIANWLLFFP
jgi:hypothetical protein